MIENSWLHLIKKTIFLRMYDEAMVVEYEEEACEREVEIERWN